ncbi:MAG: hypothetical protein IJN66_09475 [Muribaculaceae bacterium]|nr:hypothetical protein [Muribaculaceae bacterium]
MKTLLKLFSFLLVCVIYSPTTILAEDNQETTSKTTILTQSTPEFKDIPRMPSGDYIICHYSVGYINIEIPEDVESVDVVIKNNNIPIWNCMLTHDNNATEIPKLVGIYEIICITDDGTTYSGEFNL